MRNLSLEFGKISSLGRSLRKRVAGSTTYIDRHFRRGFEAFTWEALEVSQKAEHSEKPKWNAMLAATSILDKRPDQCSINDASTELVEVPMPIVATSQSGPTKHMPAAGPSVNLCCSALPIDSLTAIEASSSSAHQFYCTAAFCLALSETSGHIYAASLETAVFTSTFVRIGGPGQAAADWVRGSLRQLGSMHAFECPRSASDWPAESPAIAVVTAACKLRQAVHCEGLKKQCADRLYSLS